MSFERKTLSLAHIERFTKIVGGITEEGGNQEIVATYLAGAVEVAKSRREANVLDSYRDLAATMSATEASEYIADFFEQWKNYQNNTLKFFAPGTTVENVTAKAAENLLAGTSTP